MAASTQNRAAIRATAVPLSLGDYQWATINGRSSRPRGERSVVDPCKTITRFGLMPDLANSPESPASPDHQAVSRNASVILPLGRTSQGPSGNDSASKNLSVSVTIRLPGGASLAVVSNNANMSSCCSVQRT